MESPRSIPQEIPSPQGDTIPATSEGPEIKPEQSALLDHIVELRAEEIREQNAFAKGAALRRLEIGRALGQLKKTFPRTKGNLFYPVVERRTGMKRSTVAFYIQFAEAWPQIQAALADADDTEEIPLSLKEQVSWAKQRLALEGQPPSEEQLIQQQAIKAAQAHPMHRANSPMLSAISTWKKRILNADELVPKEVLAAVSFFEQWAASVNQQLEDAPPDEVPTIRRDWQPPARGPLASVPPIPEAKKGCLLERYPLTEEGCNLWSEHLALAGKGAALARRLGVTANAVSQHGKRVRQFLEQQLVGGAA